MADNDDTKKPPPIPDKTAARLAREAAWGEDTGKMHLIIREELEGKMNGTLERLEKGQRWSQVGLYFLGLVVTAIFAFQHFIQSFAKKEEVDLLSRQIIEVKTMLDDLKTDIKRRN